MHAAVTERRPLAARIGGLYGVTPDGLSAATLVALADAAVRGGARVIQYRDKGAPAPARRERAAALAASLAGRAAFIVNDDAALAAAVAADGVHLGEDDGDVAAARRHLGPAALVGVSCYDDYARATRAVAVGADYVAFGSFFPSRVKPQARVAGTDLLTRARGLGVPVVAIGGIDAQNADGLVAAGADAVAVISALFGAGVSAEVERAARELAAAYERGRAHRA